MKIVVFHTIVNTFVREPFHTSAIPLAHFTHNFSLAYDFKSVRAAKRFMKQSQLTHLFVFLVPNLTK